MEEDLRRRRGRERDGGRGDGGGATDSWDGRHFGSSLFFSGFRLSPLFDLIK